ncbi:BCCT family transporter [Phaeobacter sp. J2-8]|uniref:BCCT family transporter n=1 Tax=Phaeobacter sp. J2-8 TaxID=2931394 RepID=UPI001FD04F1F|nr:BCCT family transporter [Phaeobacter sp. J2-8]
MAIVEEALYGAEQKRVGGPETDRRMQGISLALIFGSAALLILFPEQSKTTLDGLFKWMTDSFDFAFLSVGFGALVFVIWLAASRFGTVKLGAEGTAPEFTWSAWGAMVFLAGIASGLMLWAGTEWAYHYAWPPFGLEAASPQMFTVGQAYGMFHWGPTAWALYCIPAVAMSYIYYVRKRHIYKVSEACRGALGNIVDGPVGQVIDYMFIFGILGAAATSLGLGTPMIGGALANVLGIAPNVWLDVAIILCCTAVFSISSGLGLDDGIKRLSYAGSLLTLAIIVYVFFAGPSAFIVELGMDSVAYTLSNYVTMSLWTDAVGQSGFPQAWTVFYWAWWVAYAPFMGLFVTRISMGRTIREVIIGLLTFGSSGCVLFYVVLGGYGIDQQINGTLPMVDLVNDRGVAPAIIEMFKTLAGSSLVLVAVAVSGIVMLATTFDSAAYVMACASTKELDEGEEPARGNRLFWCGAIAVLPMSLLFLGGLKTMQTAVVLVGLPVIVIMVFMMITTVRFLKQDQA